MRTRNDPEPTGHLTGGHVLAIVAGFFGVIFTANAALVYTAVGSFPGVVTRSSYQASQTYNAEIAAATAQDRRGWIVGERIDRRPDGTASIEIDARDAAGAPLAGLGFTVVLEHPVQRVHDHTVELSARAGATGLYAGAIARLEPGQWDVVLTGERAGERVFLSRKRVVLN